MIEKVNPMHPDKVADRIAGALVDLAYKKEQDPKIAVEVLLGHGDCTVIIETSSNITPVEVENIVERICGCSMNVISNIVKQDIHLADNQNAGVRCGDNGIFKGMPLTSEEKILSNISKTIYNSYPFDGKYVLANNNLIVCQSNATNEDLLDLISSNYCNCNFNIITNPLGYWTGGPNVDSGATNRKLGSDMAQSVTGGGLHGKDLSKADVSVNIYAFKKAQQLNKPVELYCAIGDTEIDGKPYSEIVSEARDYINSIGGFEKFAEWGLY